MTCVGSLTLSGVQRRFNARVELQKLFICISVLLTVRGPTHERKLMNEFCTAW